MSDDVHERPPNALDTQYARANSERNPETVLWVILLLVWFAIVVAGAVYLYRRHEALGTPCPQVHWSGGSTAHSCGNVAGRPTVRRQPWKRSDRGSTGVRVRSRYTVNRLTP